MKFLMGVATFLVVLSSIVFFIVLPWQGLVVIALALAAWMGLTRRGQQAASVTGVGISTLGQRLGSSAVIVVGIAGVCNGARLCGHAAQYRQHRYGDCFARRVRVGGFFRAGP